MKVISTKLEGDQTFSREDVTLVGMIVGNVTVTDNSLLNLDGMIVGSLNILKGVVRLNGTVTGNVTNNGGDLQVYGTINGRLLKNAGTTHVDSKAVIKG